MAFPGYQYFGPFPTTTQAYKKDSSGNDYYGESSSGTDSNSSTWTIFKTLYQGTAGNWIVQFPVDSTTGKASDAPKFVWASATTGTYTYATLGTPSGS